MALWISLSYASCNKRCVFRRFCPSKGQQTIDPTGIFRKWPRHAAPTAWQAGASVSRGALAPSEIEAEGINGSDKPRCRTVPDKCKPDQWRSMPTLCSLNLSTPRGLAAHSATAVPSNGRLGGWLSTSFPSVTAFTILEVTSNQVVKDGSHWNPAALQALLSLFLGVRSG
jgi:hypothetical protein